MNTTEEIKYQFNPVPAKQLTEVAKVSITKTEMAFTDLATTLLDLVPESGCRTGAMRKLLSAKMLCIQAITHTKPEIKDVGLNASGQHTGSKVKPVDSNKN